MPVLIPDDDSLIEDLQFVEQAPHLSFVSTFFTVQETQVWSVDGFFRQPFISPPLPPPLVAG
jgi:hypothetical protein